MTTPSTTLLKRALAIAENIDRLQAQLASVLGNRATAAATISSPADVVKPGRKRRKMSAAAREKIAAAQRARWARTKGGSSGVAKAATPAKAGTGKKRGGITAAGRARLAAAMKARWAARKKGAPAPNAKK
jgi:hypothetical protein